MKESISLIALSIAFLLFGTNSARATTIRSVSIDEMLERAEFIFEGKVIATEIRAGSRAATIKTCASFEILDILKGPEVVGPLQLCFAGGVKGPTRRHIHRMIYPALGETGIYFVTSLDESYVHPLYGWNQGYLRIGQKGTEAEVHTAAGEAIVAVESRPDPQPGSLSTGVARGMVTRRSQALHLRSMTPHGFKAKLRQILKALP